MSDPASQSARKKRLGELAVERGLASQEQVDEAISNQAELDKLGVAEKIGTILLKKKILTKDSLKDLLKEQGSGALRRLGNFEIIEKVGQGAMGVVFKARQVSMDRTVALKILAPKFSKDPSFIERFVKEARSAGQFNHENIVSAVDVGYADPYHYFAMEYVEGKTLRQVLREQGKLSVKDALTYTLHIARALDHAWQKKIIHRDVKPDNVIVTPHGTAKLLDMGLACTAGADGAEDEDENGGNGKKERKALGTPHYISPEGARGEEDLDTRADIYSLGCTLYHILAGETPFQGDRSRAIMARHIAEDIPDIREKRPEVNLVTARILSKLTARNREERYESPAQVIEDLQAALENKPPRHIGPPRRGGSTTGPRAPVGARGTTGPRTPIRPRGTTTGPASPVIVGDRTAGFTPTQARGTSVSAGKRPPSATMGMLVLGGVAAAVLLGLLIVLSGSGKQDAPRARPPAEAIAEEPLPVAPAKATLSPLSRDPEPEAPESNPVREQKARTALEAVRAQMREKPDDFGANLSAVKGLLKQARGTSLEAEASAENDALETRWSEAFAAVLLAAKAKAEGALLQMDFATAGAAYDAEHVPETLRHFDWKKKLGEAGAWIGERAETAATKLLADAQARAEAGKAEDLEAAIALAQKAHEIPHDLAPAARKANKEIKRWTNALAGLRKEEEAALAAQAAKARQQVAELRNELKPLLESNRFAEAIAQLEAAMRKPAFEPARDLLEAEKADLATVLDLRRKALAALAAKKGETVRLRKGSGELAGKVAESAEGSLTLQMSGGAEMTITQEQLDLSDVDRYGPQSGNAGEDLRVRALLYLAGGNEARAGELFMQAQEAGAGEKIAPYIERLAVLRTSLAEAAAQKAWDAAGELYAKKDLQGAKLAFMAYRVEHKDSKHFAANQGALAEKLNAIDAVLNPTRPGLVGLYYRDRDLRDLAFARSDAQVDFNWEDRAPGHGVDGDAFSVRWVGSLKVGEAGNYRIKCDKDDEARIWVNDKLVFSEWKERKKGKKGPEEEHLTELIKLEPGLHEIKIEFRENGGHARCRLTWSARGKVKNQTIPSENLQHEPAKHEELRTHPPEGNKEQGAAPEPPRAPGAEQDRVYLADLKEEDAQVGYGAFGKNGDLGYENKRISVEGVASEKGLSMHPPNDGEARVSYRLDGRFAKFLARAAQNDDKAKANSPMLFQVWGDGRKLWESRPIQTPGDAQDAEVDVTGVARLTLVVAATASNGNAHAVWVDPRVVR